MAVKVWREGAVGFVKIFNLPFDTFSLGTRQGLIGALRWVKEQDGCRVLFCTDRIEPLPFGCKLWKSTLCQTLRVCLMK